MTKALGAFIIALLAGIPIAFVLGITGVVHVIALGNESYFNIIVQRMFTGINNISLICIPFFIMAGEIMNAGGVTKKLLDAVREIIGWTKGGLAYATIGVGMILSAILGSAQAVAAILCSVLIPELEKDGYQKDYSGALIAASGVLGPIIPPSVVFVVYSVLANVSVKTMFVAGVVPGILLVAAFVGLILFVQSRKPDFPAATSEFNRKRMVTACIKAIPACVGSRCNYWGNPVRDFHAHRIRRRSRGFGSCGKHHLSVHGLEGAAQNAFAGGNVLCGNIAYYFVWQYCWLDDGDRRNCR